MASQANRADQVKFLLRRDFRVEMATIAWAKMFETLGSCNLLPEDHDQHAVFTVHLCEAPGAFVCATNHFIRTLRPHWDWDWMAVSLNPHYEGNDQLFMIDDDKLINATMDNWFFCHDSSGDIRKQKNIESIWSAAAARARSLGCDKAMLVTADGAVESSMDPNNQESITASLHYCELVAAFGVLAEHGNLMWKVFTLFEHSSICCLYLLACCFGRLSVYKPATSKPANSEVYVIGYDFQGISKPVLQALLSHCGNDAFRQRALFSLDELPEGFLESVQAAAEFFARLICIATHPNCHVFVSELINLNNPSVSVFFCRCTGEAISEAVQQSHNAHSRYHQGRSGSVKHWFAREWCNRLRLQPLDQNKFLASACSLDGRHNNSTGAVQRKRQLEGTLAERREQFLKRQKQLGEDGASADFYQAEAMPTASTAQEAPVMKGPAAKMMAKMGYRAGEGLGKTHQGIAAPINDSGQQSKRGLGFGKEDRVGDVKATYFPVPDTSLLKGSGSLTFEEAMAWTINSDAKVPSRILKSKLIPDDDIIASLTEVRRSLGSTDPASLCSHTGHCVSPSKGEHDSPAFWKLAALDVALDICRRGHCLSGSEEQHALDLSLNGHGASEYLLGSDQAWIAHILGVSTGAAEFKTSRGHDHSRVWPLEALPAPTHSGTATFSSRLYCLKSAECIEGQCPAVNLLVGDLDASHTGSGLTAEFSDLYRKRVLWEVLVALRCLADGGTFVLRFDDTLSSFTMSVMYMLSRTFSAICILKPFTSCAATSEKFAVCIGPKNRNPAVRHLSRALDLQTHLGSNCSEQDASVLGELVPFHVMLGDEPFYRYVVSRTQELARHEVKHLRALALTRPHAEPEGCCQPSDITNIQAEAYQRLLHGRWPYGHVVEQHQVTLYSFKPGKGEELICQMKLLAGTTRFAAPAN